VGRRKVDSHLQILTERWNGRQWQIVPNIPARAGTVYPTGLNDVTSIAVNDVWAIGVQVFGNTGNNFIEHWDGRLWHITPYPHSVSGKFDGIAAASSQDVWVVGGQDVGGGRFELIGHWDGRQWLTVPNPSIVGTELLAVAPVAHDDVWAVGANGDSAGAPYQPVIEHWDGTGWRVVQGVYVPPDPSTYGALNGIAAVSAHDVWAVGSLVERWDGARWRAVAVPKGDGLTAVAIAGAGDLWAVGTRAATVQGKAGSVPLVEHFHGPGC
jgi:hypothetical protein